MIRVSSILFILCFVLSPSAQVCPVVAANMRFAFEEIIKVFTVKTGIPVKPVYGSSGKLVNQIRNGAPYDLFISADIPFADSICAIGFNVSKPEVYAYGRLVLWTLKSFDLSKGISILSDPSIKTVAIGDIKLTPYGIVSKRLLEKKKLWSKIVPKVVYGNNIAEVAQFITSGSVDIGITAKSIVLSREMSGKGNWVDVDSTIYDPIPQVAVILKHGEKYHIKEVHFLFDFLFSKDSKEILVRYGYKTL